MWPVHIRLAELYFIMKKRPLTDEEERDFRHCLEANMRKAMKLAQLENLSFVASMIQDTQWQMEICREIDRIYPYGRNAL